MSDTADDTEATESGEEDYSHLFRSEALVSDVDLRVDVADNFSRYVAGNEDIELDSDTVLAGESMTIVRGARTRHVGDYKRTTYWEEMLAIGERYTETVHGGVHQKALFAAEAIVGGAYTNTIAGPYLRLAGWVDFLGVGRLGGSRFDSFRTVAADDPIPCRLCACSGAALHRGVAASG